MKQDLALFSGLLLFHFALSLIVAATYFGYKLLGVSVATSGMGRR
jgi:hypothetical protein